MGVLVDVLKNRSYCENVKKKSEGGDVGGGGPVRGGVRSGG